MVAVVEETGYRVSFVKVGLATPPTVPTIVGIVVYVPEGGTWDESLEALAKCVKELVPQSMKDLGPCATLRLHVAELPEDEDDNDLDT